MKFARPELVSLAGVAAMCAAGAALAGNATGTFPVAAVVQSSCSMGTINNVVFPNYDVFGTVALTTNATFQFTCTKGTTFSSVDLVAASGAVGARKMSQGTNTIAYELYQPSGDGAAATCPNTVTWGAGVPTGAGKGYKPSTIASRTVPMILRVCGKIPAQGADVAAGTYLDTVTVNVNYN